MNFALPTPRAPRNRTIALTEAEAAAYKKKLVHLHSKCTSFQNIENKTVCQDTFEALDKLPSQFVDLMFVDPPYNLNKTFLSASFKEMLPEKYEQWLLSWIPKTIRLLKPTASVYVCGDWKSSAPLFNVLRKYFIIRNRISFEREKGRGAKANWKNCSEDIWFCTLANDYYFNVDAVKLKRKVIAPYKDTAGNPKDWQDSDEGKYRLTHPSNFWTDISIPFWSMPENTPHPTQKPEKLVAKIILASSQENDVVFDPFLGSGTTSVVAKKLNRKYLGVEVDEFFCCLAEKRLQMAEYDKAIQGYADSVFWERNSQRYDNGNVRNAQTSNNFFIYKQDNVI